MSELATNALRHTASARGGYTVSVHHLEPARLRLLVSDLGSQTRPNPVDADPCADSGRGLAMVAAIAVRWGVVVRPEGRTVWAELAWQLE
ncbi:MAG: ATP-binding protein [Streptomycetales bacterium]